MGQYFANVYIPNISTYPENTLSDPAFNSKRTLSLSLYEDIHPTVLASNTPIHETNSTKPEENRFIMGEKLGKGGMGSVYQAYQPTLERNVAIKKVKTDSPILSILLLHEAINPYICNPHSPHYFISTQNHPVK